VSYDQTSRPSAVGSWILAAQCSYASRAYASLFQVVPRDLLGSHSLVNANLAFKLEDGIRLKAYVTNLGNVLYAAGTLGTTPYFGAHHGSSVCGCGMIIDLRKRSRAPRPRVARTNGLRNTNS
jgi:hypothetical protein